MKAIHNKAEVLILLYLHKIIVGGLMSKLKKFLRFNSYNKINFKLSL